MSYIDDMSKGRRWWYEWCSLWFGIGIVETHPWIKEYR